MTDSGGGIDCQSGQTHDPSVSISSPGPTTGFVSWLSEFKSLVTLIHRVRTVLKSP